MISPTIKKDSDYLNINERYLSDDFLKEKNKIINQIKMAYKKAPEFEAVFPIIEESLYCEKYNLFDFVYNSILLVLNYLEIGTEIIIFSGIDMDHSLKNKNGVITICKALGGEVYINLIGGTELYDKKEFIKEGIELQFIKADSIQYNRHNNSFIPNLSIIDVIMFNSKSEIKKMLEHYSIQ